MLRNSRREKKPLAPLFKNLHLRFDIANFGNFSDSIEQLLGKLLSSSVAFCNEAQTARESSLKKYTREYKLDYRVPPSEIALSTAARFSKSFNVASPS